MHVERDDAAGDSSLRRAGQRLHGALSAMNALLRGSTVALLSLLGACVPEYHPPTLAEPHALVKVRRTYDTTSGVTLLEQLLVDGHDALHTSTPIGLAREARVDSSLVFPAPATFVMSSAFTHEEMRMVTETYYEQESHMESESYSCGTGTSYQSCTRMVTRYRSVPRTRTVMKSVTVTDSECRAANRFAPAVDRVYLLQFNFQENGACALSCFEQVPNSDGTFTNSQCPAAPPEK
jgi:hypothetical protein